MLYSVNNRSESYKNSVTNFKTMNKNGKIMLMRMIGPKLD